MQEIRHTADSVRYLYGTPGGILEFRALPTATTTIETLIVHTPACNGDQCALLGWDCDTEQPGDLALYWMLGDDQGIWNGLAAYAVGQAVTACDTIPREPSAEQRDLRQRLADEGRRMGDDPDYFN